MMLGDDSAERSSSTETSPENGEEKGKPLAKSEIGKLQQLINRRTLRRETNQANSLVIYCKKAKKRFTFVFENEEKLRTWSAILQERINQSESKHTSQKHREKRAELFGKHSWPAAIVLHVPLLIIVVVTYPVTSKRSWHRGNGGAYECLPLPLCVLLSLLSKCLFIGTTLRNMIRDDCERAKTEMGKTPCTLVYSGQMFERAYCITVWAVRMLGHHSQLAFCGM